MVDNRTFLGIPAPSVSRVRAGARHLALPRTQWADLIPNPEALSRDSSRYALQLASRIRPRFRCQRVARMVFCRVSSFECISVPFGVETKDRTGVSVCSVFAPSFLVAKFVGRKRPQFCSWSPRIVYRFSSFRLRSGLERNATPAQSSRGLG